MKRILAALAAMALGAVMLSSPAEAATAPPTITSIDQITSTSFRVTASKTSGATSYQIYTDGAYAKWSSDNVEVVPNRKACTTYSVQVKVKANGSWSALGAPKSVTTTGCGSTPPPAPAPNPTGSAATNLGWGTPIAAGSDEFNGTAVDSTKWNNYNTSGHHGNGQRLQSQSVVAGGMLTQTGLSNGDTGYLSSKYRPGTMYGKWEVRMRVPSRDTEYHPVLLLWPDVGGNKTTEDEVDFSESTGVLNRDQFYLHYGAAGTTTQTRAEKYLDMTQWHNYAVDWSPSGVRGYIDGVLWFVDTDPSHNPNQPMHQGIQLDWFPDGTSTSTSTMQVDWTRTYR
jgi:hypothetical protein